MFCILIVNTDPEHFGASTPNRVIGPFPTSVAAFDYIERNMDYMSADFEHTTLVMPLDNPLAVAREQGRQFGNDGSNSMAKSHG